MPTGEIVAIGFLVVVVASLAIWNTRRHKGPINREPAEVDSIQYGGGDQAG